MPNNVIPIVRSVLLSQFTNIICGLSTRQGGDSDSLFGFNLSSTVGDDIYRVSANRLWFFERLGLKPDLIAYQDQVHDCTITVTDAGGEFPTSDALITRTPMIGLTIKTADCVPVLMYAPGENTIAAVHAGWKGSSMRVSEKTLHRMRDEFHVDISHTFVFIGPSASVCCYEVSEDVAKLFPEECVSLSVKNTLHLDLKQANRLQLLDAGVPDENIEVSPYCTICKPSTFHSHRRDGQYAGRAFAVIALKESL